MSPIDTHDKTWGLVPAGGRGERFGGEIPKQLINIGGRPLLAWTLDRLLQSGLAGLTVALPESWISSAAELLPGYDRVVWVAGGATRQESVAACLQASPIDASLIMVHDGARPAVSVRDVRATIAAVGDHEGAILGRPIADTLKRVDGGWIVGTIDRGSLFRAETPQVFRRDVLARALGDSLRDGFVGTDEASMVERLEGVRIHAVMAEQPNPKLTQKQDLELIKMLLLEEEDRG